MFCFFEQVFTVATMLLHDSVVLIRYVMIFCLKNPGSLEDHFWNFYINLWIHVLAVISQIVYFFSPGHWNINFYVCSGLSPYKVNTTDEYNNTFCESDP